MPVVKWQVPKWDNVTQGQTRLILCVIWNIAQRCSRLPSLLQERQRLETILNLCAEFNQEDGAAELVRSGLHGSGGVDPDSGGGMSLLGAHRAQRAGENDEEIQREESSSTESTHQEVKHMHTLCSGYCEYLDIWFFFSLFLT